MHDTSLSRERACREALSLGNDLQLQNLHVASDCKVVVDDIKSGTLGRYSAVIREIAGRSVFFDSCNFVYESRKSNVEAHNLAKFAASLGAGRHVWLGIPHDTAYVPMNIVE